jgi:XRE family transcriptional regulator, regulator of sulfur utilization
MQVHRPKVRDASAQGHNVGENIRALRAARSVTQAQAAALAGLPRATLAHLESGAANPTLSVLSAVASAFQVSLEELVASPKSDVRLYLRGTLAHKTRGGALISKLLPDPVVGMELDRLELPPGARMVGVPHTAGTREYLTCEQGELCLMAAGEIFRLNPGDVVVFRGDQKHSYANTAQRRAIAYSVVVLAR